MYLYKINRGHDTISLPQDSKIEVFTPTIRRGLLLPGEKKTFKLLMARLLFQIVTRGKARVYFCKHKENLIHTSYVIPKCYKFPFLNNNDYEIGPCFTYPEYRGQGYYPAMLRYICSSVGYEKTVFYMIVDENNASSIKGIEKAGFKRCGSVEITRLTKKYRIKN